MSSVHRGRGITMRIPKKDSRAEPLANVDEASIGGFSHGQTSG